MLECLRLVGCEGLGPQHGEGEQLAQLVGVARLQEHTLFRRADEAAAVRSAEPSTTECGSALRGSSAVVSRFCHEDAHIDPDPEVVAPIDQRDAKDPTTLKSEAVARIGSAIFGGNG